MLGFTPLSFGQELVPRAYWPSPVGANVLAVGLQRTQGDIVVDQSLPVSGVDSEIDYAQVSYQRTFDWFGRTGSAQISQSFADGTTSGFVEGVERTRRTVGTMDTVARVAINLVGAPAMDRKAFQELSRNPEPIIGASFTVTAPTGEYDEDFVINLGTNRWAAKPGIGMIYPLTSSLLLEAEAAVWFFEDNDEFVGRTREQDPVAALQLHLIKRFRPGFWGALDWNYYTGGRTTIDGAENSDLQRNSRLGATLVYPVAKGQALKLSVSAGTVTETGGDYELFSLSWISAF